MISLSGAIPRAGPPLPAYPSHPVWVGPAHGHWPGPARAATGCVRVIQITLSWSGLPPRLRSGSARATTRRIRAVGLGGESSSAGRHQPVCRLHPPQPASRRGCKARAGPVGRPEHHRGRVGGRKNEATTIMRGEGSISSIAQIGPNRALNSATSRVTAGVTRFKSRPLPCPPSLRGDMCRMPLHRPMSGLCRALYASPASALPHRVQVLTQRARPGEALATASRPLRLRRALAVIEHLLAQRPAVRTRCWLTWQGRVKVTCTRRYCVDEIEAPLAVCTCPGPFLGVAGRGPLN